MYLLKDLDNIIFIFRIVPLINPSNKPFSKDSFFSIEWDEESMEHKINYRVNLILKDFSSQFFYLCRKHLMDIGLKVGLKMSKNSPY